MNLFGGNSSLMHELINKWFNFYKLSLHFIDWNLIYKHVYYLDLRKKIIKICILFWFRGDIRRKEYLFHYSSVKFWRED